MEQIPHNFSDYAYANTIGFQHHIGRSGQEVAGMVHNIRRDHRILRRVDEAGYLFPAIIELMIAECGRVEAEQVGDFVDRQAVEQSGYRRALHQVAGIEQQAALATGALAADGRGHGGESTPPLIVRTQTRMQVISMQDCEGANGILRVQADDQNPHQKETAKSAQHKTRVALASRRKSCHNPPRTWIAYDTRTHTRTRHCSPPE